MSLQQRITALAQAVAADIKALTTGKLSTTGTAADSSKLGGTDAAQFYRRANILGTVSQSGGVPTGAIIERITNANGHAVRYADGTQECWGTSPTLSTCTTPDGSLFTGDINNARLLTFPAVFASPPVVVPLASKHHNGTYGGAGAIFPHVSNGYPTSTQVFLSCNSATTAASAYLGYHAKGRWN